jgi:hypothetical protein
VLASAANQILTNSFLTFSYHTHSPIFDMSFKVSFPMQCQPAAPVADGGECSTLPLISEMYDLALLC